MYINSLTPIFAKPVQNPRPWFYLTLKIKIDLIFYIKVAFDFLKQFQYLVDKTLSCVESKYLEVFAQSSSMKIIFLEISQNVENTCAGVSFLIKLKAGNLQLYSKGISALLWTPILWNTYERLLLYITRLISTICLYCLWFFKIGSDFQIRFSLEVFRTC